MWTPLSPWLILPFFLLILGLSLGPLCMRYVWHRFETPMLIAVSTFTLFGFLAFWSAEQTMNHVIHILRSDYIPFVVMVYALYTVSTSIKISISGTASTAGNMLFLTIGSLMASIIGTTGASMLLIYPYLKWNHQRQHKTHLIVFYILLVSNIGGSLSPLGDPPLFIGFLQGVPFMWPLMNLYPPVICAYAWILLLFFVCDKYSLKFDTINFKNILSFITNFSMICYRHNDKTQPFKIHIQGGIQLLFIPLIILSLIMLSEDHTPFFAREFALLGISLASFLMDKKYQGFLSKKGHWSPVLEICRVFLAIFICVSPIALILQQGVDGPFGSLLAIANTDYGPNISFYFWLPGIFSAFLDNAPTYLIFFKMLGGSAQDIIANQGEALKAISMSSIFFGAMTYIGNAPNFMIRTIAKQHDIHMPSFMGYIFWAALILLPLSWMIQWVWFF